MRIIDSITMLTDTKPTTEEEQEKLRELFEEMKHLLKQRDIRIEIGPGMGLPVATVHDSIFVSVPPTEADAQRLTLRMLKTRPPSDLKFTVDLSIGGRWPEEK